ncbi:hypothetical protein [Streptomyces sp. NPDC017958]
MAGGVLAPGAHPVHKRLTAALGVVALSLGPGLADAAAAEAPART